MSTTQTLQPAWIAQPAAVSGPMEDIRRLGEMHREKQAELRRLRAELKARDLRGHRPAVPAPFCGGDTGSCTRVWASQELSQEKRRRRETAVSSWKPSTSVSEYVDTQLRYLLVMLTTGPVLRFIRQQSCGVATPHQTHYKFHACPLLRCQSQAPRPDEISFPHI